MDTVYSQGTWRQSKLQVHIRESKAAWTTEVFYFQGRELLAKQENKIPLKMDSYLIRMQYSNQYL